MAYEIKDRGCSVLQCERQGDQESSSSEESTVSTVAVAPAPPDEPDSEDTSEIIEPSPEPPPCPPEPPPDEPPNNPDTAWILGPSSCSLGPKTWPTIPLNDARPLRPFCGASIPYCLLIAMFCLSSVSTNRVFASINELIF